MSGLPFPLPDGLPTGADSGPPVVTEDVGVADSVITNFKSETVTEDVGVTDPVTVEHATATDSQTSRVAVQALIQGIPDAQTSRVAVQALIQGIPTAQTSRVVVEALIEVLPIGRIADPVGVTDTVSFDLQVSDVTETVTDAVGVTDATPRIALRERTVTDAVGVIDAVAQAEENVEASVEPVGVTDDTLSVLDIARTVTDDVGVTDDTAHVGVGTQVVTDDVDVTDATAQVAAITQTITDDVDVSDATSRLAPAERTVTEDVDVTDSTLRVADVERTVTDPVGVTDDTTDIHNEAGTVTINDPVAVLDQVLTAQSLVRSDSVGVTDNVLVLLGKPVIDGVGVTDSVLVKQDKEAVEAVVVADDTQRIATFTRTSTESVAVQDQTQSDEQNAEQPVESVGVTDQTSRIVTFERTSTDDLGVTDITSAVKTIVALITDDVGVADLVIDDIATGLFETSTDGVGITDNVIGELIDPLFMRPTADAGEDVSDADPWQDELGGTDNLYSKIFTTTHDDSTYIESSKTAAFGVSAEKIFFEMSDVIDPGTDYGHTLRVRARRFGTPSSPNSRVSVYFYENFVSPGTPGDLMYYMFSYHEYDGPNDSLSDSWVTYEFKLPVWMYNNITDWSDITVGLDVSYTGASFGYNGVRIAWVEHEIPVAPAAHTDPWAHELAIQTIDNGTTFDELLSIPASRLDGDSDYLLLAHGKGGTGHGGFSDAQLTVQEDDSGWTTIPNLGPSSNKDSSYTNPREASFFADIITTPSTPNDIRLAGRSNHADWDNLFDDLGLQMIDLSQLTVDEDYFIVKNTTGVTANSGTYNELVTKDIDVTDGDEWLFIGSIYYTLSADTPTQRPDFRLTMFDNSTINTSEAAGKMTLHNWGMIELQAVDTTETATAKIDVRRLDGTGTQATVYGQLIGLRLGAFKSYEALNGGGQGISQSNIWYPGQDLSSFSPAPSSNMLLIAGVRTNDSLNEEGQVRVTVDGWDVSAPSQAPFNAPRVTIPENIGTRNLTYETSLNVDEGFQVGLTWAGPASDVAALEYNSSQSQGTGVYEDMTFIAIELGLVPITEPVGVTDNVLTAGSAVEGKKVAVDAVGVTDTVSVMITVGLFVSIDVSLTVQASIDTSGSIPIYASGGGGGAGRGGGGNRKRSLPGGRLIRRE
jgi:hypothetical protein